MPAEPLCIQRGADMPSADARIDTDRPSRYLVQLCRHASAMGAGHSHGGHAGAAHQQIQATAEWSEDQGLIRLVPLGQCSLVASPGVLMLHIDAETENDLVQIRQLLTADLHRFSSRDRLEVNWKSSA